MKTIFLRVGIDRGCGRTLSPRFADGTFEYVPIPESCELLPGRGVAYSDLAARHGGTMDRHAGLAGFTHYDPEFETFTYGEPSEPKRSQLMRLSTGDYLVFYSGFQGPDIATGTCFMIGYLCVRRVHQAPLNESWPPFSLEHLHRNAHFRRKNPEPALVVVEGEPSRSKLFKVALPFSDGKQKVLPEVEDVIGFGGSVMRAVGRWVPETHQEAARVWLTSHQKMV
jgi:hypothetical protein